MFDKMVKMKNKKGFTLVEMLVVIAVIAILVSIVVPVVGNSTNKARAATNAANLRSVEGQLSTMRVSNPELFKSAVDQLGSYLGEYQTGIDLFARLFLGMSLEELLADDNVFSQYARYKLYHSTASADGILTITDGEGNEVKLENVPAAKGISIPGMEVAEGTPMTVYISDTDIVATYEYAGGSYGKFDFSEVAETGEYTGTASSGLTEEEAEENVKDYLKCTTGNHDLDENCKCTRCLKSYHSAENTHNCTVCDTPVNSAHVDKSGGGFIGNEPNGDCDYTDCEVCLHIETVVEGITICKYCTKTKCEIAGTEHNYVNATCTVCGSLFAHECEDTDGDHYCNTCPKKLSDHSYDNGDYKHDCSCGDSHVANWAYTNKTTHTCKTCGETGSHKTLWGYCTLCLSKV